LNYSSVPDKNVHPDAKHAFDCVQEAYQYALEYLLLTENYSGRRAQSNYLTGVITRQLSFSNTKKIIQKYSKRTKLRFDTWKARLRLLLYRLRQGHWKEEMRDIIVAPLETIKVRLIDLRDRFCYAPSVRDRLELCGELLYDHKLNLLASTLWLYYLYDTM
jgi:hypothetical protein